MLLYIHGESYDWGSGNPYDGSVLASYTDQVIVTMNYRLGVLGFLNANVAPQTHARVANYGLMDRSRFYSGSRSTSPCSAATPTTSRSWAKEPAPPAFIFSPSAPPSCEVSTLSATEHPRSIAHRF